jgi:hypothetical protein
MKRAHSFESRFQATRKLHVKNFTKGSQIYIQILDRTDSHTLKYLTKTKDFIRTAYWFNFPYSLYGTVEQTKNTLAPKEPDLGTLQITLWTLTVSIFQ